MSASIQTRLNLAELISVLLLTSISFSALLSTNAAPSYSIELEEFRWRRFPLKVLVDMNEWSVPDYAVAAREAFDAWMRSVGNYTQSYNDTTLAGMSYVFYVSNANFTSSYDVLVSFTANEITPSSNTVGLTTYRWDTLTNEPIPPIITNITTYDATASHLFVRNVIMHEFGHALGDGHASSPNTLDGPELMYYASAKNQVVYPSTLDVYALNVLYKGNYNQIVQLPSNIPYKMLTAGSILPPPTTSFWETYQRYILILAAIAIVLIAAGVLARIRKEAKPEQPNNQEPLSGQSDHSPSVSNNLQKSGKCLMK